MVRILLSQIGDEFRKFGHSVAAGAFRQFWLPTIDFLNLSELVWLAPRH